MFNGFTPDDALRALVTLDADQVYVINAIYWWSLTEVEVAVELTNARGVLVTRDRVHRIHRTALEKMRRYLQSVETTMEVAA